MQNHYPPIVMQHVAPNTYKDALNDWDNGIPNTFGGMMWQEMDDMTNKFSIFYKNHDL
jgi:hypothetical protein